MIQSLILYSEGIARIVDVDPTSNTADVYAVHVGKDPLGHVLQSSRIAAPGSETTAVFVDIEHSQEHIIERAANHGWTATRSETGWNTATRDNGKNRLYLGFRHRAVNDPLIGQHVTNPSDILYNLQCWLTLTGRHYRHNPGHSTAAMILDSIRGRARPRLIDQATTQAWQPPGHINDIRWDATRAGGETAHRWDMRSAYLAAAAQVELPARQLVHTGYDTDGTRPGYYRISSQHWPQLSSHVLANQVDRAGMIWVCHPTVALIRERQCPVEIVDSWTAHPDDRTGRILRSWADNHRDLLATPDLDPTLIGALKAGYAQAIGLLAVAKGPLYRPDWRHMIIDQVRASLLRRILHVAAHLGQLPNRIHVDSIWYPETAGRAEPYCQSIGQFLGVGSKIGNMRYEGWETL